MLTKTELIELYDDLNKVKVQNGHIVESFKENVFGWSYNTTNSGIVLIDKKISDFENANLRFRITINGMKGLVEQKRDNASSKQHKILDGLQKVLLECEEQWKDCSLGLSLQKSFNDWYNDNIRLSDDSSIMFTAIYILRTDIDQQIQCFEEFMNSVYALKYKIHFLYL